MLILTRRVGETLMIGDSVSVTVLGVKGNRCVSASPRRRTSLCIAKRSISASSVVMKPVAPVAKILPNNALPSHSINVMIHAPLRCNAPDAEKTPE